MGRRLDVVAYVKDGDLLCVRCAQGERRCEPVTQVDSKDICSRCGFGVSS